MIPINVKQVCQLILPSRGALPMPKSGSVQCRSSVKYSRDNSKASAGSLRKSSRPLLSQFLAAVPIRLRCHPATFHLRCWGKRQAEPQT